MKEKFSVETDDGVILNGNIFLPGDGPKSVVVINAATAINADYYNHFAHYLSENGHVAVIWNYRSFNKMNDKELANSEDSFSDFGTKDIPSVLQYVHRRFAGVPLIGIGHSVGGQQVGMIPNNHLYSGFIAVATSGGYALNMPLSYMLQSSFFFKLFGPVSLKLKNYVYCKKFKIMEDLPKNVFNEWKDWSSKRDYLFDKKFYGNTIPKGNYERLPFPVHVINSTDDEVASPKNVENFWKHVNSEDSVKITSINPKDFGYKSIKHLGYFRRKFKTGLWKEFLNSIESFAQPIL